MGLAIDFSPVSDIDYEHDQPVVDEFADDPVVTHAITPVARQLPDQRLAELARIVARRDAMIHVVEDAPCFLAPELRDLAAS